MGIFDKLRMPTSLTQSPDKQAVLVYLKGEDFDRMIALSNALEAVIEKDNLGKFDGNEISGGEATLFMYGPDSEALYAHIEPVLLADKHAENATVIIRQGLLVQPNALSVFNRITQFRRDKEGI